MQQISTQQEIPVSQDKRDLHRVSAKAMIFTPNRRHVLVMHMYRGTDHELYGLPGGHVDAGELLDDTIAREIREELGVTATGLHHVDFFLHENGKIVLVYTGVLPFNTGFNPPNPAKEIGVWLTREEFENIVIEPGYKKLILENWHAAPKE